MPPPGPPPEEPFSVGRLQHDFTAGAAKEAGDIFGGLGQLVDRGVAAVTGREPDPAFKQFRREMQPSNKTEAAGGTAMELLSFLGPGAAIKTASLPAALLKEGLTQGVAAAAQEGEVNSNVAGAAALGAGGAAAGAGFTKLAPRFEQGARDTLAQVLRPGTSAKAHRTAVRGIDTLMEEGGFRAGSLDELGERMGGRATETNTARAAAEAGASGNMIPVAPIRQELVKLRGALGVKGTGTVMHEGLAGQYDDLLASLDEIEASAGKGGLLPRDTLVSLKQQLDEVYKTADPNSPTRRAMKRFGDTIRRELDVDAPDVAEINRKLSGELSAKETIDAASRKSFGRPDSQAGETGALRGLSRAALTAGGGATAGYYASGQNPLGAAAGAAAPFALMRLMNSPRWLTTSAAVKRSIAQALESGAAEQANEIAGRVLASTVSDGDDDSISALRTFLASEKAGADFRNRTTR